MKYHFKQDIVKQCIEANIPVLLTGEAGSGKTTIALNIAKEHEKEIFIISGSKQVTLSNLKGFISIDGKYIPSQLRKAVEEGHYLLIDEIDAMDSNVLLSLNTIENGIMEFPDKVINIHPDFRLIATANPMEEHSIYTGRSKLDFSTLDRFYTVPITRDKALEKSLVSEETFKNISIVRKLFKDNGISKPITMRDSLRVDKLTKANIVEDSILSVIFLDDTENVLYTDYLSMKDKYDNSENENEGNLTFKSLYEKLTTQGDEDELYS